MLAAAVALVLLLLLILVVLLYDGACPSKRRTSILFAVEALEDRVVPALTMLAVKARIAAEFPAVADPTTPDIVRVSLLRTWAFQETDHGDNSTRLDKQSGIGYYHRSLPQMVELFDKDAGSVQSAGDGYFLTKLYQAYGYRTGRLAVGFQPASYEVTLVRVRLGNGQFKTLIEDAGTDRTAVDLNGEPLDAKLAAKLARQKRADEVFWQEGENNGRDLLFSADGKEAALTDAFWEFDPAADSHDAAEIRPGVWKMHGSARGDRMEGLLWQNTVAPYIDYRLPGAPLVFASSFAFPVWASSGAGPIFTHNLPGGATQTTSVRSVSNLKARIAAEFPALNDRATPDTVRVGMLRTWAFEQVELGDHALSLEQPLNISLFGTVDDMFRLFSADSGTILCGTTAIFLQKLYASYGYVAGLTCVGFTPSGNHCVALVQVRLANGQTDTLIEDAFTDLTAVDANGQPIGVKQVAKLARMNQGDKVFWQEGNSTGRDLLLTARGVRSYLNGASWSFDPATDSHEVVKVRPGVYKLHAVSHPDRIVSMWWTSEVAPAIRKHRHNMPLVLASTFAFPLMVQGPAGAIFASSLPPGNLHAWHE